MAARAALTTGGVQDWYLPSLEEMEHVWRVLGAKSQGQFSAEPYWTSSQSDHPYAWFFDFRGGKQYYNGLKSTIMRVRAIRSF